MLKPCIVCGEPSASSYCDEHEPTPWQHRQASRHARGYDAAWTRLSKRARRLSPFCEICGATDDLTTDHLPSAWERKAEGKPIRLADVRVLCRPCNVDAGSSRPENLAGRGSGPGRGPRGKPRTPSLSTSRDREAS